MEKQVNEFDGLITMIKTAITEKNDKVFIVEQYANKFVYYEMISKFISTPFEFIDKNNICQHLYDCLISEFGEQLVPGYSCGLDGSYKYFMTLGDNIMISFPADLEYQDWIYNQVQKDSEKRRKN